MNTNSAEFVYTTYIKSTAEKVWRAITTPEFTRQYWGKEMRSDWKQGSSWEMAALEGGKPANVIGKVLESAPPKKLVLSWIDPQNERDTSRVKFEIEAKGEVVKLNIVHDNFSAGSTMLGKISGGWPLVLSSMKSFLETGEPLDIPACKGSGAAQPEHAAAAK